MLRTKTKKRPCKICRKWFLPDVRHQNRQKTCGNPECRKEWHRRQCEKWNNKNSTYFKSNYLAKKLDRINEQPSSDIQKVTVNKEPRSMLPQSRIKLNLPRGIIKDVIGVKQLVIIEYMIELIVRRYQEAMRVQLAGIMTRSSKISS